MNQAENTFSSYGVEMPSGKVRVSRINVYFVTPLVFTSVVFDVNSTQKLYFLLLPFLPEKHA